MKKNDATSKDVSIIGSGVGGLSTAIFMARLGYRPTVIEKNPLPGGLMRGYTRAGIECSVGVHYLGALGEGQVLRRLFEFMDIHGRIPVERMGGDGVIDRYLFEDFSFDLPEGFDAYEENLRHAFPNEQPQIAAFMKTLRENSRKVHSLEFLFSAPDDFHMIEGADPLGSYLDQLNCSPGLKAVIGVPCCWMGVLLESCPVYYHNMALATYLFSSWRLKCGGSRLARVFVERLQSLGGRVILDDGVENVLVDSRIVRGVRLKSGLELKSPLVIGAVHPKVVLGMLPDGAVKPSYRKRISHLVDTDGMFSAHVSVDASSHECAPHNIFKIQTARNGDIRDLQYYQLRESERADRHLLTILTSGEPRRWRRWSDTLTGRRGPDYLAEKEKRAWQLIRESEEILGPLQNPKLLDAYTPLTIRDHVNSPGGSAYGVLRSSRQLLATSLLNRTAVKGLYLAGQNVMAPGIPGAILGSLATVKLIAGPERFFEVFGSLGNV